MTEREIEHIAAFNRMWAEVGAFVLPRFLELCREGSEIRSSEGRRELPPAPIEASSRTASSVLPETYRRNVFGLAPVSRTPEVAVFVEAFLSECAERGEQYWTEPAHMRRCFEVWRIRVGVPPVSQTALGRALRELGYAVYHGHRRRWYGFRLPDLARVERGASEGR